MMDRALALLLPMTLCACDGPTMYVGERLPDAGEVQEDPRLVYVDGGRPHIRYEACNLIPRDGRPVCPRELSCNAALLYCVDGCVFNVDCRYMDFDCAQRSDCTCRPDGRCDDGDRHSDDDGPGPGSKDALPDRK